MNSLAQALRKKTHTDGVDWDEYGREHVPSQQHLTDRMHRVLAEAFVDVVSEWDRRAQILEIGCGDGFWLEILRNLGFDRAIGIDCSLPLLERAAAKGLNVRRGDLYDLDVIDMFDIVLFCDTLEHLPYPAKALQRAHRAMRTHAKLFLMVPVYESVQDRWRRMWHRLSRDEQSKQDDETHAVAFSSSSLARVLDDCYFSVDFTSHVGNTVPTRRDPVRWTYGGRHGKWLFTLATSLFHVGWEDDPDEMPDGADDEMTEVEAADIGVAVEPMGVMTPSQENGEATTVDDPPMETVEEDEPVASSEVAVDSGPQGDSEVVEIRT